MSCDLPTLFTEPTLKFSKTVVGTRAVGSKRTQNTDIETINAFGKAIESLVIGLGEVDTVNLCRHFVFRFCQFGDVTEEYQISGNRKGT